jgi:hypothetical protein
MGRDVVGEGGMSYLESLRNLRCNIAILRRKYVITIKARPFTVEDALSNCCAFDIKQPPDRGN